MSAVSRIRVVTTATGAFGGIVLMGTSVGAVTARVAATGRPFLVAAGVTAVVTFIGGMLAGPTLLRVVRLRGPHRLKSSASAPESSS